MMQNQPTPAAPFGGTVGLDITDRHDLVGICYTTWFNAILGSGREPVTDWHNVTEVEAGRQSFGPQNAFHYWAKPAIGYYRSDDKAVMRRHMIQLAEAGVDFIILDYTYEEDHWLEGRYWDVYTVRPMTALCDTIVEMRAEGLRTPYVVCWIGTNKGHLYKAFYDRFYGVEKWRDCFVYWDGKPFILSWGEAEDCPYRDIYTVRTMRGLGSVNREKNNWSFLTVDNRGRYATGADGKPEQVTVAVATQETYMSAPTAHGRDGGFFWFRQWHYAFETHPKIVTLTWWNEWCAQRLEVAPGVYEFTDNYNIEYSRDIEPMEGGHGDRYYQWLIQYIAAYKSGKACPVLVEPGYEPKAAQWLQSL